jgi:hypothetical protein
MRLVNPTTGLLAAATSVAATNVYSIPLISRAALQRRAVPAGIDVPAHDWFNRTDNEVDIEFFRFPYGMAADLVNAVVQHT